MKSAVNKELENKRTEKVVGSGLSAEATLYCNDELGEKLTQLGGELRFALILSAVEVRSLSDAENDSVETAVSGLKLRIAPSQYEKCERCWHHNDSVGQSEVHPTLCARCEDNIYGEGEQRQFA